jgi:hypothetical protein
MGDEIEIPENLINPKAREMYVREMGEFYRQKRRFYSAFDKSVISKPLGRFCEGGAQSCALENALNYQRFLESTDD